MEQKKAITKLCSRVAKAEGKKHEASIGDVREIIGFVAEELYKDAELTHQLLAYGCSRVLKKEGKKK